MKKKSLVFLIVILMASSAFLFASLTNKRVKLDPNAVEFQSLSEDEAQRDDYTVKLQPGPGGTFYFEIRKKGKIIYIQRNNPFYISPEGFLSRPDAFNVAWWIVDKFKSTARFPLSSVFNESLERELSIHRRHNH